MKRWILLVALAACSEQHFQGGTPPTMGGDDTSSHADASTATADAPVSSARITGTVCWLMTDLRSRTCTPLTGSTLKVVDVATGESVSVADDGAFALPADTGRTVTTLATNTDDAIYYGAAAGITLDADGAATANLFVMKRTDLDDAEEGDTITQQSGEGILLVHVNDQNAEPESGATVTLSPYAAFYDEGDPEIFSPSPPTAVGGTAIFFDLASGTYSPTASNATGTPVAFSAPVVADCMTTVDVAVSTN